jgi:hypothetical protein
MDSFNDPFFNSSTPSRDFRKWDLQNLEFRLPIFFFARYALDGLSWFEAAFLRDRGGGSDVRRWQERAGKRLGWARPWPNGIWFWDFMVPIDIYGMHLRDIGDIGANL